MKVKVINWTGMPVGKELNLPDELAEVLINQGNVESLEKKDVKISKGSRNKSGDNNLNGGESVVEGDTHE